MQATSLQDCIKDEDGTSSYAFNMTIIMFIYTKINNYDLINLLG